MRLHAQQHVSEVIDGVHSVRLARRDERVETGQVLAGLERLCKQLHDHVTRNHAYRAIEPLMEALGEFIEGAQPFPGTQVSMLARAA